MSTKPLTVAPDPDHDFEYEIAAASELLRVAITGRPRAFMDAKRSATCRLLRDLCALFGRYGYQASRRADREWGHVWSLTFFHESICLTVAKDGSVHGWVQPHQGERKLCGLDLNLTYDPALDRWLGPWPPSPVGQAPSVEHGRTSALGELTRSVLVVIQHQVRQ